jgi:hypothetical protein
MVNTTYTNIGWQPWVHSINLSNVNDCVGYIKKLTQIGTNSPGQIFLSASAVGYGNTNYYFDGDNSDGDPKAFLAMQAVMSNGVPASAVDYTTNPAPHIISGTNVAGYWSYGGDGLLPPDITTYISWAGNSGWYIMGTVDSWNGQRSYEYDPYQSFVLQWFFPKAFGGTNYSSTPVGAVSHVYEPYLAHVEDTRFYFGLWAAGKSFGICAWNSIQSPQFQATGDPFVKR